MKLLANFRRYESPGHQNIKVNNIIAWSAIDKWGSQALSILVLWILARILGPEPFGLIALASAFTSFVQIFLDQGMTEAVIREPELSDDHLNAAFFANMVGSILLLILTLIAADSISSFYREPRLAPILRWLSISFVLFAFSSTQISQLRRELSFRVLAIRSILSKLIAAIVAIIMALFGAGVWSLVAQLLIMSMVSAIVLWHTSDWHPKIKFSKAHITTLYNFGIKITGARILGVINEQLHDFAIGYLIDTTALGLFSLANTFTKRLVSALRNVILDVAYPVFSRYQDQPQQLRFLFDTATRYTALMLFPIYAFIFLLAPELVIVLFGPEWIPATQLTRILALMGGVYGLVSYFSQLLMALGKMKIMLRIRFFSLIMNALGLFIGAQYGLVVIAIVYVASWYILIMIYYYFLNKFVKLKGYLRNLFGSFVGVVVMSVCIIPILYLKSESSSPLFILFICGLVSILTYGLSVALVEPKTAIQLSYILISIINKKQEQT